MNYPALSLDLGQSTGWCLDTGEDIHHGTLRLKGPYAARLAKLQAWLTLKVKDVGSFCYEAPFIHRPHAARHGYGYEACLLAEAYRRQVPVVSVPPASLKKFATGNGRAVKMDMQTALRLRWPSMGAMTEYDLKMSEHEVDAIWVLEYMKETGELPQRIITNGN